MFLQGAILIPIFLFLSTVSSEEIDIYEIDQNDRTQIEMKKESVRKTSSKDMSLNISSLEEISFDAFLDAIHVILTGIKIIMFNKFKKRLTSFSYF